MNENKIVDHLFRHQFGKMVAVLTRIFGLRNLETIEDAVQDTFLKASLQWRSGIPENPEGWLIQAARNRMVDLLRKIKAENERFAKIDSGASAIHLNEMFLDHEIEDAQLRMIFVACHPRLKPVEQIGFALKTVSGFSTGEIAAALLQKEETIKKRLSRARKAIAAENIRFEVPGKGEVAGRLDRVMEVIYLIFNEGYHSTQQQKLIREDLCGEAIRLCKLLLRKPDLRSGKLYALFALLCFHAARLPARIDEEGRIVDIREQDRSQWFQPLVDLGNTAMDKAMEEPAMSTYHYEAAIAAAHLAATSFEGTNWRQILVWYQYLQELNPSPSHILNMAIVNIQLKNWNASEQLLRSLDEKSLEQRGYLLDGAWAEYYGALNQVEKAKEYLSAAIRKAPNKQEKEHLSRKLSLLE